MGSLAVHAALGVYLWKAKFEPHYRDYQEEEVTDVTLVKPPPPPPPPQIAKPPPPPPAAERPPPVQPRPPAHTPTIAEIPPLPIAPVVQRVAPESPPVVAAPPKPPAPKPAPPPAPTVITQPDWRRLPSADDIARYYPERAQRMGVEGRAAIGCSVTTSGTLRDCAVTTETPADAGFGEAALRMSRLFQMKPMTKDGQPVADGKVTIPIHFVLAK